MEVVILDSTETIGAVVSSMIVRLVERRPDAVIGLATGDSPQPVYRSLIDAHDRGEVSLATAHAVALDEYVGLPRDHPSAYRQQIIDEFVDHVDLPLASLHTPDVHAHDLPAAGDEYERLLRALGGVDLQLLGIGVDGHIGFNEPTSSLSSRTRIKSLHPRTRSDNARFFGSVDEVPLHVLTQGIGTILDSRHAVLVATGEHKAEATAAMIEGPLGAVVPASALQLHRHATIVIDEAAASRLRLADYYRATLANKPEWQHF